MTMEFRTRRHSAAAGFTMVELLVASVAGSILALAIWSLLSQTQEMALRLTSIVRVNGEARAVFRLLRDGGVQDVAPPAGVQFDNPDERAEGYHGRSADPANDEMFWEEYTLKVRNASSAAMVTSTMIPTTTIRCRTVALPLPTCLMAGEEVEVKGLVAAWSATADRAVASRTRENSWVTFDPVMLELGAGDRYSLNVAGSGFWTAMQLMVDP